MNDELTPEELASAYLDGEVSAAERAQVEASPELLALVARYRKVAASVAEPVVVPSAIRRDAAIAAALAAGPRPAAASKVSSLDARRSRRWPEASTLAGAAAAIVLLVGAVGIVSQLGGGNDDDDTAAEEVGASDEARAEEASEETADTDNAATDEPASDGSVEAPAAEATEEAGEEAVEEETTEEATEAATEEASGGEATEAPAEATPVEPSSPVVADLGSVDTQRGFDAAIAAFALESAAAPDEGDGVTDAEPVQCGEEAAELAGAVAITAVGRITFQGVVLEIYLLDTQSTSPEFLAFELPNCSEFAR